MNSRAIKVIEKAKITKGVQEDSIKTGCCGGTPVSNTDACCVLDEDKKEAGESGCGCSTPNNADKVSGCC